MGRVIKPYLFLLPAAAVLFLFHLYPLFSLVEMSVRRDGRTNGGEFVGLANYRSIFASGEFPAALGVTLWYAALAIPTAIGLALVFAVLLQRRSRSNAVFRTLYFLPYVTSTVAAAAVWRWILHPDRRGLANAVLGWFGADPVRFTEDGRGVLALLLGGPVPLLGHGPSPALLSVVLFAVWHVLGFYAIILSAGLAQVPREVYEAASLDGAGPVRSFFSITLPLLRPVLGFLVAISTIAAFQTFNQIYIMAPSERFASARNLTMYVVTLFYDFNRLGEAAAAAVCLFIILLVLTAAQLYYHHRRA